MKKTVIILTLLFALFHEGIAYNLNANLNPKKTSITIPNRYRSLGVKFGPRFLNTKPGIIITNFVDNSPSQDYFSASTPIKDNYNSMGLQIEYNWRRYNGLNHSLYFDLGLNKNTSILFGYSIGYAKTIGFGSRYLVIRPAIGIAGGNYRFALGEIENTTGYIQIDKTIYTDRSLKVDLVSQFFVWGPQLDLRYSLSDNFHLTFQANYDIANSDNKYADMEFASNSSSKSSKVTIGGDNPQVLYNGEILKTLPFDASGIRSSIGISYTWNRE